MASFLQYLGLAFGFAVIGLGLTGFFRGLSLPPNTRNIARTARATVGAPERSGSRCAPGGSAQSRRRRS